MFEGMRVVSTWVEWVRGRRGGVKEQTSQPLVAMSRREERQSPFVGVWGNPDKGQERCFFSEA